MCHCCDVSGLTVVMRWNCCGVSGVTVLLCVTVVMAVVNCGYEVELL